MAKSKSGYCAAIDKLPWILRLIFALPVLDGIIYGIYRICSGVASGSVLKIVMGIVWIFVGAAIFWIIDIILRQGHRFGLTADLKSLETGRAKALPVFLKSFVFKMRAFFGHFIFSVLPRRLSQLHFSPIEISVHIVEKKGGKTSDDRYAAQIRFCGERP